MIVPLAAVALCVLYCAAPPCEAAVGPGIVLDRREGSGVVCVTVAVNVGSSCETSETRGASHFIEHMAFDGSERYSREEISGWVDDVGGFLNAFTRKETTVYFLLVPSAQLEKGVEVLSQMLLHPVFIPQELEKERKVILEEIRRETDDPREARDRAVDRVLYRGSALTEPVIGYPATVETMSETVLKAFWRRYYRPSNMRIVVTGAFDPAMAERLVGEYFPADRIGPARAAVTPPTWSDEITVLSAGGTPGFDMIVPFPAVDDKAFPAALLVSKMLEGDASPLAKKLAALSLPAPDVSLEICRGFSSLRIHVDDAEAASAACAKIPEALESLAGWAPAERDLEAARVSFLSGEMFDREMYHLYVMMHGEPIALYGERYLSQCGAVSQVTVSECARLLKRVLSPLRFNACLIGKGPEPAAPAGEPRTPAIETLPNGCVAGAVSRPGSPVSALHLMFRGRACSETAAPTGLPELLLTVLKSSAAGRVLSEKLDSLGAQVAYGDNPYITQDDYLLNPSYSFIRLEAPAKSIAAAASLLLNHIVNSPVTDEDLTAAKASLAREVGMRSASPYYTMRNAMMAALFGSHPYGAPLFPSPGAMMRVPLEDVRTLRARLFAGGNTIATLVSPESPERGCEILKELVGKLPAGPAVECPQLPDSVKAASIEKGIRKEGAYIAAGWLGRCPTPAGTASLLVAAEILSRRMQLEMREKQGLSYSIECGGTPLPGGVALMAYLGTGAPKLEEARASLEREVRLLRERAPDASEVEIAKSRLLGKRARSGLSSINEAYALGFDVLLDGGGAFHSMNALIGAVTADDVNKAIGAVLAWDRAVVLRLVPEAPAGR
ncbi:MAG: insulinase family protein [Candidatus Krumholzibacteriaceae bacterium]